MLEWIRTTTNLYGTGKLYKPPTVEKKPKKCPELACDCPEIKCKEEYVYHEVIKPAPPAENITVFDHKITVSGMNKENCHGELNEKKVISFEDSESSENTTFIIDDRTKMVLQSNANTTDIYFYT